MTAREAVTLNESVPQLQVPQVGDTYLFPRDCTFTTAVLTSSVADGASAVGFTLTTAAMSTSGAKLLSIKNNTTEMFRVQYDRSVYCGEVHPGTTGFDGVANGFISRAGNAIVINDADYTDGKANFGELGGGVSFAGNGFATMRFNHFYNVSIYQKEDTVDRTVPTFSITAAPAYASSSTNLTGGAMYLAAGAGASGSAGAAHGGALYLDGGRGYGTGSHGSIYLGNSYCNGIICGTNFQQFTEMTAPSAGASNTVRLYAEDNGAGKTRLMAIFPTGAAQQVAIEP